MKNRITFFLTFAPSLRHEAACLRRQALEQRRAELQQRRQEAAAEKQKERLDYAIKAIDDHGGYISRKQLMAILMSKFKLERSTVSKFIASQVKAEALYEADNNIYSSQNMPLPF